MTYPISQMRPDYFLAREIRKKVNLLSEDLQLVRVSPGYYLTVCGTQDGC